MRKQNHLETSEHNLGEAVQFVRNEEWQSTHRKWALLITILVSALCAALLEIADRIQYIDDPKDSKMIR